MIQDFEQAVDHVVQGCGVVVIYLKRPRSIHLGRAKLLLSPHSQRLARRLALPIGKSFPRPFGGYKNPG